MTATTTTHTLKDRRGADVLQEVVIVLQGIEEAKLAECLHCNTDICPRDNTVEAHEQFASEMVSHVLRCEKSGRTLPLSPDRSMQSLIATGAIKSAEALIRSGGARQMHCIG